MIKRNGYLLLSAIMIIATVTSARNTDVTKRETIRRTLKFASTSGSRELIVDNMHGEIKLVGHSGDNVELVVKHIIRARNDSRLERAREEIVLEIEENGDIISLFVDGPFRRKDGSFNYKGWRHYGYEVTYEFDLKVPKNVDVFLRTVNDGEIQVSDLVGNFDVKNINGGVEMRNINGSGRAYALNGSVEVSFVDNPREDSYFGSLNGDVDVTFQSGFDADVSIKTFNGSAYSDFPFSYLPAKPVEGERKRGKFVYKSNKGASVRIGSGGPDIEFDGFNGDIHIYEAKN